MKQKRRQQYLDRRILSFPFCCRHFHRLRRCHRHCIHANIRCLLQYGPLIYLLLFYAASVHTLSAPFASSLFSSSSHLNLSILFQNFCLCQKHNFPLPLSTTPVSILLYLRRGCLYYPTYLPVCSYTAISATSLECYPCYLVSMPPQLSSYRVSTLVFIKFSSIVPRPSLSFWYCIYAVSSFPLFLPLPHLYFRRPHRTCHLLFHWHYPLSLHCHHF